MARSPLVVWRRVARRRSTWCNRRVRPSEQAWALVAVGPTSCQADGVEPTRKNWVAAYDDGVPPLTAFVYHLCGDQQVARKIAQRVVLRSLVTWRDVRDGEAFELRLRGRAAVALARHERLRRVLRPRSNEGSNLPPSDEPSRVWLGLPLMRRAVLALLVVEERSVSQAAVALDRSEAAVRGAANDAARRLGYPDLDQIEGLRERFARPGGRSDRGPDPASRWMGWQRGLAAVLFLALLASGSVAAVELGAAVANGDLEERSLAARRAAVDLTTPDSALNVARRSTFQWCPDVNGVLPFDETAAADAADVALRFNIALVRDREGVLAALVDHSATTLDPDEWGHTLLARGIEITFSAPARGDGRAQMGCGTVVAQRSWKVVMHDATRTATAGLAAYYLVKRDDGWKVWGSYGGRRF
jgi:hypothetical protein